MGDDLRRPSASHFAFGLRTPRLGAFRAIATGVGRWLSQRYTVRLSDPSTYSPVELRTAGDERVTAFAKDLSSAPGTRPTCSSTTLTELATWAWSSSCTPR